MDKDEFKEQTEKDFQGNWRFKDSKKLVHRWVAFKYIYLKDRKKYPLPFEAYEEFRYKVKFMHLISYSARKRGSFAWR